MPLVIEVKVVPGSGQQKCIIDKSGKLKCYLKSPAQRGLANQELIKFFANSLKLTQTQIEIITGLTSPKKKLRINKDISFQELLKCFNIEIRCETQGEIFK